MRRQKHKNIRKTSNFKPNPGRANRYKKVPFFYKIILSLIIIFVLAITIFKIAEFIISNTCKLPQLEISLKDVPIEQIDAGDKDIKYPNNSITFTNRNESITIDGVEIKGRGNSTWMQAKKPYQIKFSEKTNFFNYGEAKKWILLANYLDHTHLRTDTAYYIKHLLGDNLIANGNFIELYIDKNYHGLYYITEKIEIDKNRVNLKDPSGIIVEIDNLYGINEYCYRDSYNNCLVVKDLVNEDSEEAAISDFVSSLNNLESVIATGDYKKIQSLIDIDSFARYYLLSEFLANPDAYNTSFFMYKDGVEDKIHAGPSWDFDLSFISPPFEDKVARQSAALGQSFIVDYFGSPPQEKAGETNTSLIEIPEFSNRVKEIYQQTLSGHGDELLNYIESRADYIRSAAYRDQNRWKHTINFDDEVDYLIDWVAKRYSHFEEVYGASTMNTTEAN